MRLSFISSGRILKGSDCADHIQGPKHFWNRGFSRNQNVKLPKWDPPLGLRANLYLPKSSYADVNTNRQWMFQAHSCTDAPAAADRSSIPLHIFVLLQRTPPSRIYINWRVRYFIRHIHGTTCSEQPEQPLYCARQKQNLSEAKQLQ